MYVLANLEYLSILFCAVFWACCSYDRRCDHCLYCSCCWQRSQQPMTSSVVQVIHKVWNYCWLELPLYNLPVPTFWVRYFSLSQCILSLYRIFLLRLEMSDSISLRSASLYVSWKRGTARICCCAPCCGPVLLRRRPCSNRSISDTRRAHSSKRAACCCRGRIKKVKFSYTRYRALGPELIPVYRQSACRWREANNAIDLAVGCHYFLPGLRLPP